jgi:hypothetical protein
LVKTDKYKKGILLLSKHLSQMDKRFGSYEEHYIVDTGHFKVRFTQGAFMVTLELARLYESGQARLLKQEVQKVALTFVSDNHEVSVSAEVDAAWRRLFLKRKEV